MSDFVVNNVSGMDVFIAVVVAIVIAIAINAMNDVIDNNR